jgi:HEPN domain-containing protein
MLPYTHSLMLLARKAGIALPEEIVDRLAEAMEFHIEARYPDDKKSFYAKCTREFANEKFAMVERLYEWLTQKLETASET